MQVAAGRVSSPAAAATADCCWLRCTIVISLCGQGISCPSSVIGGWGGALPPHFGQKKSRRPFSDFLLGAPLCWRRVFNCKSSGQVGAVDKSLFWKKASIFLPGLCRFYGRNDFFLNFFQDGFFRKPLCQQPQVDPMCGWKTGINQVLVTFRIVGYQFYKFLDKAVQYSIYHYPHTQR